MRGRFFRAFFHLGEVATWVAVAVALLDHQWLISGLLIGSLVFTVGLDSVPREAGYWILGLAMFVAYRRDAATIFYPAAFRGLGRSLRMQGLVGLRASAASWEAFFAGRRPGPGLASLVAFWRRRGRVAHIAAWPFAIAIGVAWPAGIFWAAHSRSSGWSLPFEIGAGAVLYLWPAAVMRAVMPGQPSPVAAVGNVKAVAIGNRRAGATCSPSGWATDAIYSNILPPEPTRPLDLSSGFAGPLDPRLRLFAADCAEHLLAEARTAGASGNRRAVHNLGRARARATGRLPSWRLPILVSRARDGWPLESRFDRRSDAAGDAACAAFHALAAPTPLNAAAAAANCTAVTATGELRPAELSWQRERLDWYRSQPFPLS